MTESAAALAHEHFQPDDLLKQAGEAELAGFDGGRPGGAACARRGGAFHEGAAGLAGRLADGLWTLGDPQAPGVRRCACTATGWFQS